MSDPLEDSIEAAPAVRTLRSVLGQQLRGMPSMVRQQLEEGDYSAALSAANELYSSRGPGDSTVALTYAVLLVGRGLIDEALGVLRRAREHDDPAGLQLVEAEARLMVGQFEEAETLLEALQTDEALQPHQRGFLADLFVDVGDEERAVEHYRVAIEQGFESADAAWRLARLYDDRSDDEQAAHYLARAAEFAGDDAGLWQAAAEACWEVGLVEEATRCYERMLDHRPYDTDGWFTLGLGYWFEDRFEQAAEAFEKVVDLNPRHRVAWTQLGDVWLTVGHGERALRAYRQALQLKEDDVDVLNGAAMAAYETGDLEAALEWVRRALEIDPKHPDSRFHCAVVLLSRGRAEEAYELLRETAPAGEQSSGALAVAALKTGREDEAFEHIDELTRQDTDGEWLAAFAEELLKVRGVEETLEFIEDADPGGPNWQIVSPLLAYVCSGLLEDDNKAETFFRVFREAVDESPDALPVFWNFEAWEAVAFRLQKRFSQTFEAMLAVVEGRSRPDELEEQRSR